MKLTISLILAALALGTASADPAPTPAPLGAALSAPVETERTVTFREAVTEWRVQWMLVDPDNRRITVMVQPFSWQVTIQDDEYDAASAAIRPLLEAELLPVITTKIQARASSEASTAGVVAP